MSDISFELQFVFFLVVVVMLSSLDKFVDITQEEAIYMLMGGVCLNQFEFMIINMSMERMYFLCSVLGCL